MTATINLQPVHDLVGPVCEAHGVELVDINLIAERGGAVLRVLIDREGSEKGPGFGVSISDCQSVSRDVGTALEVHEVIPGAYRLEVGSPGLDRPLVKLSDFERFAGKEIKMKSTRPQETPSGTERSNFRGVLLGIDGLRVRIKVDGVEYLVPHSDIAKANVIHRFD